MHLICPPKFCISIVLNFSWDNCNTRRNEKQRLCKIWGANKVHYRKCGSGVRIDNQVFLGMTLHSNARNACGALLKQQYPHGRLKAFKLPPALLTLTRLHSYQSCDSYFRYSWDCCCRRFRRLESTKYNPDV